MPLRLPFFAVLILLGGIAQVAAQAEPDLPPLDAQEVPFINSKSPLKDSELKRLTDNGYKLQPDGKIVSPDSGGPVNQNEMPMILDELAGKERLKAMLQLDVIFNQYGYTNLPADVLEKIRSIAKEHWEVLPDRVRDDLKPYFSAYELDSMQRMVQPAETPHIWLPKEEKAETVSNVQTPPTAEAKPAKPADAQPAAPTPASMNSVQTPIPAQKPSSSPSPAQPAASAVSAAVGAIGAAGQFATTVAAARPAPLPPTPVPSPAAAVAASAAVAAPAAAIAAVSTNQLITVPATTGRTIPNPSTGTFSVTAPAAQPRLETPIAVSTIPTQAAPAKPSPPPVSEYLDVTAAVFDQFLAESHYDAQVKALLRLISQHSPSDSRRTALGVIMRYSPKIAIDGRECGLNSYSARQELHPDLQKTESNLIFLNPGPVFIMKKSFLLGSAEYLLPSATSYYQQQGVSRTIQAISAPAESQKEIDTAWGSGQEFADGSVRLRYSDEQLAGTLIAELTALDGRIRGWDSDLRHLNLRSEANAFMFFRQFKMDTGKEAKLIPELKARFSEWLDRPDDYWDFELQTAAAPRLGLIAPSLSGSTNDRQRLCRRYDVEILEKSGLITSNDEKKLLKEVPFKTPAVDSSALLRELSANGNQSIASSIWRTEDQRFRESINEKK